MPIYKVSGNINEDAVVYIIDEDTDVLEIYEAFPAGAYEISNLAGGTKLVVASMSNGNSISYGGVVPTETSGDSNSSGKDGALVVDTEDVTVNDYTNVTAVGVNNITVGDAGAFEEDDEVLIIQTQTAGGNIGNWETQIVSSVNSNVLTFTSAVDNSYSVSDKVQAVRIPNYTSVTVDDGYRIICPAWNGSIGGIIFFRAQGIVTLDGAVFAKGKGFRGSAGRGGNTNVYGWAGESTIPNSYQAYAQAAAVSLGGGGGAHCGKANDSTPDGGAGGGFATSGGNGRHDGAPQYSGAVGVGGSSYGAANLDKLYFGSAGGNSYGSTGGHGGGIIIISAGRINISSTGTINSDGISGWDFCGSGAGGTIWLQANTLNIGTNFVSGAGGAQSLYGGAGGDGRIRLDYTTLNGSTNNPTPGYTGSYD